MPKSTFCLIKTCALISNSLFCTVELVFFPMNLWTWLSRWHWSDPCYRHTWPNVDKISIGKAFFQRARFDSKSMIWSECHDSMWSRLLHPIGDCFLQGVAQLFHKCSSVTHRARHWPLRLCKNNVILPHVVQYADSLFNINKLLLVDPDWLPEA